MNVTTLVNVHVIQNLCFFRRIKNAEILVLLKSRFISGFLSFLEHLV